MHSYLDALIHWCLLNLKVKISHKLTKVKSFFNAEAPNLASILGNLSITIATALWIFTVIKHNICKELRPGICVQVSIMDKTFSASEALV